MNSFVEKKKEGKNRHMLQIFLFKALGLVRIKYIVSRTRERQHS